MHIKAKFIVNVEMDAEPGQRHLTVRVFGEDGAQLNGDVVVPVVVPAPAASTVAPLVTVPTESVLVEVV